MLALADGRLAEALPVRALVPVEGLLLVGRLLTVGLLTAPLLLVRPETLPETWPVEALLVVGRPERLPPVPCVLRPSFCKLWLIEPVVPPPFLTLAT